jgi:hypothetical protein
MLAPSTASLSSISRYASSFAPSSSPASVSTATARERSADAYCATLSGQYDATAVTADGGSAWSRVRTR